MLVVFSHVPARTSMSASSPKQHRLWPSGVMPAGPAVPRWRRHYPGGYLHALSESAYVFGLTRGQIT